MFDTYLPAFQSLVEQGKVYSLMGAYNSVDGVPACANTFLRDTMLRKKWGFKGYVVSDCGAISDIYRGHKYVTSEDEAAAVAVKAGCDLTCGDEYVTLDEAVKKGEITEQQINISVSRLLLALFKLGMFDSKEMVAYKNIHYSENNSEQHNLLSKQATLESIVLLQNKNNFLPLSLSSAKTIAVVGPFANDTAVLLGNYNGEPGNPITFLQGIKQAVGNHVSIITDKYIKGPVRDYANETDAKDSIYLLVKDCSKADVVIFCGGLSPAVEGEESGIDKKGFFHGDRTTLSLPDVQEEALKALKASGKKVILVMTNGGAMAINWENENLNGIIEAWYPGQNGGAAVADVLFGKYNPAGRLPVTFYKSLKDLPPFEDYDMKGRTYRYFRGTPLYPFGYGLSYSKFKYSHIRLSKKNIHANDSVTIKVIVRNISKVDGDEVVQVYASARNIPQFSALKTLIGFKRIHLNAGQSMDVAIGIAANSLREYDASLNDYAVYKGTYQLFVTNSSADDKNKIQLQVE
jgi:beta-glucosidase